MKEANIVMLNMSNWAEGDELSYEIGDGLILFWKSRKHYKRTLRVANIIDFLFRLIMDVLKSSRKVKLYHLVEWEFSVFLGVNVEHWVLHAI